MSETSSVRGVDAAGRRWRRSRDVPETFPETFVETFVEPSFEPSLSRLSVVSVESGGDGPPHSRFRRKRGTPGGFLSSRGRKAAPPLACRFFSSFSSDLCVCNGETRSTSSRSSSCGDPAGAETRGDCDGVVPRDEFKELPSRFVPSAVPVLDADPGTRKSASFLCLCVGGLGVARRGRPAETRAGATAQ